MSVGDLAEVESGVLPVLDQDEGENHLVVDTWNLSSTVRSVARSTSASDPFGAIAWMWGSEVDLKRLSARAE